MLMGLVEKGSAATEKHTLDAQAISAGAQAG